MTKLVQINTVCNGSTGKIMGNIQKRFLNNPNNTAISFYGRRNGYAELNCEKFGSFTSFWYHVFLTTVFDKQGHGSYFYTKKMIDSIKSENPDIIHLHNIHGYYLNYPLLFDYLNNEFKGKIFWTFHDCWPFTGHCPHFVLAKCSKWKNQCYKCPNKKQYPISLFFDNSRNNYIEKKELFTKRNDIVIITPSNWMNNLIKQSFFNKNKVVTINNGIDLNIFKNNIDAKVIEKYNIPKEKEVLLGVSNVWTDGKGYQKFLELAKVLDENYLIILVGVSSKQIKSLPKNIIGIKRTENIAELVSLYSRANIFINPSYEESFSLVTVEAIACGTPVIALNTSAVKELINDKCGIVLKNDKINSYIDAIKKLKKLQLDKDIIINESKKYDVNLMLENYMTEYED